MAILAVVGSGMTSVDARSLLVSLDRDSYWYGEEMNISGVCDNHGVSVVISIYNPLNHLISISQVDIAENGQFESSLTARGSSWNHPGHYTVKVECAAETHMLDFELLHPSDKSESVTPEHEAYLTARLDRNSYRHGETMNISGVCNYLWNSVYIQVYDSSGNLVHTGQVESGSNGRFDSYLTTDDLDWDYPERYTVKVICAGETRTMDFKLRPPFAESRSGETTPKGEISLTANLDKNLYRYGETINVSGVCDNSLMNSVSIIIYNPSGNVVHAEQAKIAQDGRFSLSTAPSGIVWNDSGHHTVRVSCEAERYVLGFEWLSLSDGSERMMSDGSERMMSESETYLTASLDKKSYRYGDAINVDGVCDNSINLVAIHIRDPSGNMAYVDQVETTQDGRFSSSMTPNGNNWDYPEHYTVRVVCSTDAETILGFELLPPSGESERTMPEHEVYLTASLDKESYRYGETINVSGVCNSLTDLVSIRIHNPSRTIVHLEQIKAAQDGQFNSSITPGGITWNHLGNHTVGIACSAEAHTSLGFELLPSSDEVVIKMPGYVSDEFAGPQTDALDPTSTFEIIPEWVKDIIVLWVEGKTTDAELIGLLEYLVEQNIVKVDDKKAAIAEFVDLDKDPSHYIERYNNEPEYREWFDMNYPDLTIYEAVGIHEPAMKMLYEENLKLKEELRKSPEG